MSSHPILEKLHTAQANAEKHRELNAFVIELYSEAAVQAAAPDAKSGALGDLLFSVKDLYELAGTPLRAGTKATVKKPKSEGPVLRALLDAGAICIGKTNTHEIALGLTGENPWTGDVRNPVDPLRQSGGSSSGSAVSVAIDACDFSLGTDTAGSIRVPASHCGIFGFKPTFGLLSTEGILPLVPSCDHVGILAKRLQTIVRVLSTLTPLAAATNCAQRLAFPRRYLDGKLSEEVQSCFEQFCAAHSVDPLDDTLPPATWIVNAYGKLRREARHVHREALLREPDNFSPAVRDLLQSGDVSDLDYEAARRFQDDLCDSLASQFRECDFLILPTVPVAAPLRGTTEVQLVTGTAPARTAFLHLTLPFSMGKVPAISLPLFTVNGLPVGLQIVGKKGSDADLLELSKRFLIESSVRVE